MAIFGRRWKKREDETDIKYIETRAQVFDETSKLTRELIDDAAEDVRDLMIREDLISEELAEYIPTIKKYGHKLGRLYELSEKACKIEIARADALEENMEDIKTAIEELASATKAQNAILDKIAKAMEKKEK